MAIYVFTLLVGYQPNGVDNAQGIRNCYLKKLSVPVYYFFSDIFTEKEREYYCRLGIDENDMVCSPMLFSDYLSRTEEIDHRSVIDGLINKFLPDQVKKNEYEINLYRNNERIVCVKLKNDGESIDYIYYYSKECLIIKELYGTKGIIYTCHYTTERNSAGNAYAQLVKYSFKNDDGTSAIDIILGANGKHKYLFPNGRCLSYSEFLSEVIIKMNFSSDDIILIDRPFNLKIMQPLFQYGNKAKFVAFLHSGHFYLPNEEESSVGLNYEYFYLFRNISKMEMLIVSTENQKQDLICKLEEFGCKIPRIEVIPISGIEKLNFQDKKRRPFSLLAVSRIVDRKKIIWLVNAAIKAHRVNDRIMLDIYGEGPFAYYNQVKELIKHNNAESYIRLMGHQDVKNVYKEYEIFVTASIMETFGLATIEALGSGNAIIGFDVRYGNPIMIHDGENGTLIPFDLNCVSDMEKQEELTDRMALEWVSLLEDEVRLREYQANSYEISKEFLNTKLEQKWIDTMESLVKKK